jgi:hypothetical protein
MKEKSGNRFSFPGLLLLWFRVMGLVPGFSYKDFNGSLLCQQGESIPFPRTISETCLDIPE